MSILPRFVGRGTLMFNEGDEALLEHVGTTTRPSGVVVVSYRPKRS